MHKHSVFFPQIIICPYLRLSFAKIILALKEWKPCILDLLQTQEYETRIRESVHDNLTTSNTKLVN